MGLVGSRLQLSSCRSLPRRLPPSGPGCVGSAGVMAHAPLGGWILVRAVYHLGGAWGERAWCVFPASGAAEVIGVGQTPVVQVLGVAGSPRASSSWCSCSIMSCVCVARVVFLACNVLGRGGTACACTSYCVLSHARVHHIRGWQVAYLLPLASASPGFSSPAVVHCTNCALYARLLNRSALAM